MSVIKEVIGWGLFPFFNQTRLMVIFIRSQVFILVEASFKPVWADLEC